MISGIIAETVIPTGQLTGQTLRRGLELRGHPGAPGYPIPQEKRMLIVVEAEDLRE